MMFNPETRDTLEKVVEAVAVLAAVSPLLFLMLAHIAGWDVPALLGVG